MDIQISEKTKPDFQIEGMLKARELTLSALNQIIKSIKPGMTEAEAQIIAENILSSMGCERKWHRTWIRFGPSTINPYGVLSDPNTTLQSNDIFFVDMGPVWNGYEGDAGATQVVGNNPEMLRCATDAKQIFGELKDYWDGGVATGQALYDFAEKRSTELGWKLNLNQANGHRLSDFPHALYYKGSIADLDFHPSQYLWVLELQIRHPTLPFGAFIEDLLV